MHVSAMQTNLWTSAPLRLSRCALIKADVTAVFHALSDLQAMCDLFAWIDRVTVAAVAAGAAIGVGTLRTCVLANGLLLEEEIVDWRPPYGYAYRGIDATHPFGMRGYVGALAFEPTALGCQLVWQQYFDHSNVPAMCVQLALSTDAVLGDLLRRFGGQLITST